METIERNTSVLMPNDTVLDVSYYCTDKKLEAGEKATLTHLVIQLHDCICLQKIERRLASDEAYLERAVHNKVINSRGHLC